MPASPTLPSATPRLTARTPIGTWAVDPVGGPLLHELLARKGLENADLSRASGMSLATVAGMGTGLLAEQDVEALVRAANGGELVPDEPTPEEITSMRSPVPVRDGIGLDAIQIRDPFLVVDPATEEYVLLGSTDPDIWEGPGIGFDAYRSSDLCSWTGPFAAFRPPAGFWSQGQYWAPEVHRYRGRWYMLATFSGADGHRGTQVLVADSPTGPFEPWSDGPVTPASWQCLDGTLHVDEDGMPWMVFCHEWTQVGDGTVEAVRLSEDLREAVEEPTTLFRASDAAWAVEVQAGPGRSGRVTDGPFLHRTASGELLMLWSTMGPAGYAQAVARSLTGRLEGPWAQEPEPLWSADGGHGMVARLRDGSLSLVLHSPNTTPLERAVLVPLVETEAGLAVVPAEPA